MQKNIFKIFILIIISTGCRTLPKITPFVEASSEMRKGVKAGFDAVDNSLITSELTSIVSIHPDADNLLKNSLKSLDSNRVEMGKIAKVMDKAMLGITDYSGALNSLAESGNYGKKNTLQVTNALKGVLDQLSLQPISAVVGLTEQGVSNISKQIIAAIAAKKIKQLMDSTSPVLDQYNLYLSKILDELGKFNEEVYRGKSNLLVLSLSLNPIIRDYNKILDKAYISNFREIGVIEQYKLSKSKLNRELLLGINPSLVNDTLIETRQQELILSLRNIEEQKQKIAPVIEKLTNNQKRYLEEKILINQLFKKTKEAITSWINSHENIRKQLGKKGSPNFQELIEIVDDLTTIKEKLKTLNK
jgi:hypothetical protein